MLPLQQLVQARAPPVISESMSLSQAFMTKYERSGTAKLSASVKGSVLETLGYMLHAAPQVIFVNLCKESHVCICMVVKCKCSHVHMHLPSARASLCGMTSFAALSCVVLLFLLKNC